MLLVILLLTVGCVGQKTPLASQPQNYLCTSGLKTFTFTEIELEVLTRHNKENALLLNCHLHSKCGYSVPNAALCERLGFVSR